MTERTSLRRRPAAGGHRPADHHPDRGRPDRGGPRRQLRHGGRGHAGGGGRIRVGQDHAGPGRPGPGAGVGEGQRVDPAGRARAVELHAGAVAVDPRRPDQHGLPGPDDRPEPDVHGRLAGRRVRPAARAGKQVRRLAPGGGPARRRRAAAARAAGAPVPARAVGRHAPAGRDRDGDRELAAADHRGRAHHGPGRDRPGADPRHPAHHQGADRGRADGDQPRSRRAGRDRRADHGHVRGQGHGDRQRARMSSPIRGCPTPPGCWPRCRPSTGAHRAGCAAIPGIPPTGIGYGAGCAFAPRCPLAAEPCAADPPLLPVAPGHLAACHFAGQAASAAARSREPITARTRSPRRCRRAGASPVDARRRRSTPTAVLDRPSDLTKNFRVRGSGFRSYATVHAVSGISLDLSRAGAWAWSGSRAAASPPWPGCSCGWSSRPRAASSWTAPN